MNHSTGRPTKLQSRRLERIAAMRCCACELQGHSQPWATEVHHLVDNGTRELSGGHDATIPLCAWHHRGICKDGVTAREMELLYGPSMALNKRAFVREFHYEREFLARINARLGIAA